MLVTWECSVRRTTLCAARCVSLVIARLTMDSLSLTMIGPVPLVVNRRQLFARRSEAFKMFRVVDGEQRTEAPDLCPGYADSEQC